MNNENLSNELNLFITSKYVSTKSFFSEVIMFVLRCKRFQFHMCQVLMSVLTATEGAALGPMVRGIVQRYRSADVTAPKILYVDRDCCNNPALTSMFDAWPELTIRLGIWHFMRRLAVCATSDSHPLYGVFMGRLSACIFEWSAEYVKVLRKAKRAEMAEMNTPNPSDDDVQRQLSKRELANHCRRRTRGAEETREIDSPAADRL